MISASIGIPCYNEESTIGPLLVRINELNCRQVKINEVILVSSGCTDKTDQIIGDFVKDKPLYIHVQEPQRRGKAAAINEIIKRSTGEIVFIVDGDIMPLHENFDLMAKKFKDPEVGAVGSRNIPLASDGGMMDYITHNLWYTYHNVVLRYPKLGGDMIAFRRTFTRILEQTAIDDQSAEVCIRSQGYNVLYEPYAINFITAPKTVKDFLTQRRRIHAGYYMLGERPQTVKSGTAAMVLKYLAWDVTFIVLEVWARMLGWYDYRQKRSHVVWDVINREPKKE